MGTLRGEKVKEIKVFPLPLPLIIVWELHLPPSEKKQNLHKGRCKKNLNK
jgi:hypothetical protein